MSQSRLEFTVKIAGIPIGISCAHLRSSRFFRDYLTDEAPLFTVRPEAGDLERMREGFARSAAAEGREPEEQTDVSLENAAIHDLIADAMPAYGVLLMHGSALALDGQAYIFTAPSGTGKSTHARFWRETFGERCVMINDDKPMIAVRDTGSVVYGTPWNGKHRLGSNISAPLKAIIRLSRSEENAIAPMSMRDAFPLLLRQAYSSRSADGMRRIVALEQRLTETVRFYSLGCNLDPGAAMTAYLGMNGAADHPAPCEGAPAPRR